MQTVKGGLQGMLCSGGFGFGVFFCCLFFFFSLGGQENSIMHIINTNYKQSTYSDDIPIQYSLYGYTQSYFLAGLMSILVCCS